MKTTLKELKREQNKLKIRMLTKLAMINYKKRLLNELEKKAIDITFSKSHNNRSRFKSKLNEFLITGQRRTGLNVHHSVELSCAERKSITIKLEDIEGTSSSVAGRFIAGYDILS